MEKSNPTCGKLTKTKVIRAMIHPFPTFKHGNG